MKKKPVFVAVRRFLKSKDFEVVRFILSKGYGPKRPAPQRESLLKLESMTSFLLTSQVLWMSPEFYRPFSMWIMY